MHNAVIISESDFDSWAKKNKFAEFAPGSCSEKVYSKEIIHGVSVVIFSSIDVRSKESRDKDSDAIRVVLRFSSRIGSIRIGRVYRTKGWKNNLTIRVEEAENRVHESLCPLCNNPMVLRNGKYGEFYSCIMFPATGCKGKPKRKTDE